MTSSMLLRVMRAMTAVGSRPRERVGRDVVGPVAGAEEGEPFEADGEEVHAHEGEPEMGRASRQGC